MGAWQPGPVGMVPEPPRRAIADLVSALDHEPATPTTGLRKLLHMGLSRTAAAQDADEKLLRTQFPRPVMIVIANPNGGSGKSPTAIGLGSAFGLARGAGVVVWDNHEARGTLSDRAFSAHRNSVVDMLDRSESLLRADARVADIQALLNYQANGQFWVLSAAKEVGQPITPEQFKTIREILSRFFSIIIVETGNSEAAPNWAEAVVNADVLLTPTKWRKDNVVTAGRMIETLTSQGRDIVNRMIVVGTNGPGELMPTIQSSVANWFAPAPIIEIPTDKHLSEGAEIDWNLLQPTTRRAYQSLGAAAARMIVAYLSGR